MKRFSREILTTLLIVTLGLFNGCSSQVESLSAMRIDRTMPQIYDIKTELDKSSIGFEWKPIKDKRVSGIEIYRAVDKGESSAVFKKIATIRNRYATHFVDTDIVPNMRYIYTFNTYGGLKSSPSGTKIRVTAPPPLGAVDLVTVYLADKGVVKLLWRPHPYPGIYDYVIERRLEGRDWKYLATVKGRLIPEYIDMSPAIGYSYSYRVIARLPDRIRANPSKSMSIFVE